MKTSNTGQMSMDFGGGNHEKVKKPHNPQKKKLANKNGLAQFLDGDDIDIQKAWGNGYIDELKGLFGCMVCDLQRYKRYRKDYKNELSTCIKLFGFSYFDNKDVVDIEKFLWSIQDYFIQNPISFDHTNVDNFHKVKKNDFIRTQQNDYIKTLFRENIEALGRVGQKVNETSRAVLIMSLYRSYTGSKKQPLNERKLRYNRLFFQNQLENNKTYYPNQRTAYATSATDLLFNNLGSKQ